MGYVERKVAKGTAYYLWIVIFYGVLAWLAVFWVWSNRRISFAAKIAYTVWAYIVVNIEFPLPVGLTVDGLSLMIGIIWFIKYKTTHKANHAQ